MPWKKIGIWALGVLNLLLILLLLLFTLSLFLFSGGDSSLLGRKAVLLQEDAGCSLLLYQPDAVAVAGNRVLLCDESGALLLATAGEAEGGSLHCVLDGGQEGDVLLTSSGSPGTAYRGIVTGESRFWGNLLTAMGDPQHFPAYFFIIGIGLAVCLLGLLLLYFRLSGPQAARAAAKRAHTARSAPPAHTKRRGAPPSSDSPPASFPQADEEDVFPLPASPRAKYPPEPAILEEREPEETNSL